ALLIFFFQAEDGIRDGHVTGVQTCALPISRAGGGRAARAARRAARPRARLVAGDGARRLVRPAALRAGHPRGGRVIDEKAQELRSEERRVGKEGRCRWWGEYEKKRRRKAIR